MPGRPVGGVSDRRRARRPDRGRRAAAPTGTCLLVLLAAGCTAPGGGAPSPLGPITAGPVVLGPADAGRIDPGVELLLEELAAAWRDRDVPVARRLIELVRLRTDDEPVLAVVDDYRRRLDGHELGQGLELRLVCSSAADEPSRTSVRLVAENANDRALELHLLTPTLERRVVHLGALGLEARARADQVLDRFAPLALGPGAVQELELARFERGAAGALASRESYALDPAGSWLVVDGELLPLPRVDVEGAERVGLASFLPASPLSPTVLIDYLDDPRSVELPEDVFLPALLERTVRIPASARLEAVALLAEGAPRWSDAQLLRAAPAFRWLTRALDPGGDPRAWRAWFAAARRELGRSGEGLADRRGDLLLGSGGR